jgi:hypothetical protein
MVTSRREIRKSLSTNFNPGPRYRLERAKLRAHQLSHVPGLLTGGTLDRPIFIIGGPRSGTHFLYLTLRDHSRFAHWRPSEAHEVWEADYHPMLRGWESNVLTAADITHDAAARIQRSFYLCAGSKLRFIDKTPRNVMRVPFIDGLFPDARYIFLQRDGRDTVNSLMNAWRSNRYKTYRLPEPHAIPGTDPQWWKFVLYPGWRADTNGPLEVVAAKQWFLSNEYALSGLDQVPAERRLNVRYEDIVDHPVEEIGRIMDFFELPYEEQVRAAAEATKTTPVNTVTPPEQGKWRRENGPQIESILPLIAPTMKKLGYE